MVGRSLDLESIYKNVYDAQATARNLKRQKKKSSVMMVMSFWSIDLR